MASKIILEWDEDKRKSNFAERGIDFADAVDVLADPNMSLYLDERADYGEERFFKVHNKEWSKYYEQNN